MDINNNMLKPLQIKDIEDEDIFDAEDDDIEYDDLFDSEEDFETIEYSELLGFFCCYTYFQIEHNEIDSEAGEDRIISIIESARNNLSSDEFNRWMTKYVKEPLINKSHKILDKLSTFEGKCFADPIIIRSMLYYAGILS